MGRLLCFLLTLLSLAGQTPAVSRAEGSLTFQIVRTVGEEVLWESPVPVKPGDRFTIEYRHSSDHTPVRDLFTIGDEGEIILIEESYLWYGAGLESHPAVGKTDFAGDWTRVRLHRPFPRFLLRVGDVASQVLTIHGQEVPLLSIAKGGDSVWIRVKKGEKIR
ncbi:MAG: DUF1850 domain-containing protein [Smithellaceae bacterium]|nr:DUF1850 domain-containing protein [Smithellaceae bacterium]